MPSKKRNEKGATLRGPHAEGAATRLKVTLVRSPIGLNPTHARTLQALGLRRIRATVWHDDTAAVRGMLAQVPYAVRVETEDLQA